MRRPMPRAAPVTSAVLATGRAYCGIPRPRGGVPKSLRLVSAREQAGRVPPVRRGQARRADRLAARRAGRVPALRLRRLGAPGRAAGRRAPRAADEAARAAARAAAVAPDAAARLEPMAQTEQRELW